MTDGTKALTAMVLACIIWGLSPIPFKAMEGIPPQEIIAHRALWSLIIFGAVLAFRGQFGQLTRALRDPRGLGWIMHSAAHAIGTYFFSPCRVPR